MRSVIFLLLLSATQVCAATAHNKPNVIIFFMDDMGYGDIGPYGATKQKTPNLDRMAREVLCVYEQVCRAYEGA